MSLGNAKIAAFVCTLLPTATLADWSGYYGGLTYGSTTQGEFEVFVETGSTEIEDSAFIGAVFGLMGQRGDFVRGGELVLTFVDEANRVGGTLPFEVDTPIYDFKYRYGYAIDNILPYLAGGVSSAPLSGDEVDLDGTGFSLGVGVDMLLDDRFLIGVEYYARFLGGEAEATSGLAVETGDFDVRLDTLSVRAAYKF